MNAKYLGAAVYLSAVILATIHNINLYSAAATNDLARLFAVAGAAFVGLNAIALPLALHKWAVSGAHRGAAIVLYAIDAIVLTLNAIVDNSLATGVTLPPLLQDYLVYAPATFILPLVTWGVLFVLDPGERAKVLEARVEQEFNLQVAQIKSEWLLTAEGRARAQAQAARTLALGDGLVIDAQAAPAPLQIPAQTAPAPISWTDALKYRIAGISPATYAQTASLAPAVADDENFLTNSQERQSRSGA